MRKRKEKRPVPDPETLNPLGEQQQEDEEEEIFENENGTKGFFACYLLTSLCPRYKGHTYIGFTVNPRRRIRQHNGEIGSGAFRTKKRRPWEMVLCIYGFPSNVSALQFEWAWQHPTESLAVRQAAATFKSFSGVVNKIKLAYTMLNLPNWQSLNITVNYFSTKYSIHSASCPSLPEHMKVQVCTMDDLPCYGGGDEVLIEDEEDSLDGETSENSGGSDDQFRNPSIDVLADYLNNQQKTDTRETNTRETTGDANVIGIVQENNYDLGPRRIEKISTTTNADKNNWKKINNMFDGVEVIDLLTPSPNCRVSLCSKKRRVSSGVTPVIIDLT